MQSSIIRSRKLFLAFLLMSFGTTKGEVKFEHWASLFEVEETAPPESVITIFRALDTDDAEATLIYELYSDIIDELPVYIDRYSGQFLTREPLLGKVNATYSVTIVATNMHTAENMRELVELKIVETAVITTQTPETTTSTSLATTPTLLFPSAEDIIDSLTDITTEKLDSIANAVEAMALAALQDVKVAQSLTDVVGAVLQVDKEKLDTSLTVENSKKLLKAINFYVSGAIIPSNSSQLRVTANNVEINLLDVPTDFSESTLEFSSQVLDLNDSMINQTSTIINQEVSFSIPAAVTLSKTEADTNSTTPARVSFVVYHNSKLYKQREPVSNTLSLDGIILTLPDNPVLVADVPQVRTTNLTQPVSFKIQKPSSTIGGLNYSCVYWNPEERKWSTEGVYLVSQTEDEIECEAYHMTAFSILFDPTREIITSVTHKLALSIISYIGCAISCIGCLITSFTYIFFRYLHADRAGRILINLCLAIALLNSCFLFGSAMSKFLVDVISCAAISTLVHFFALASFMWMGIEALNMHSSLIQVFYHSTSQSVLKRCVAGWGLPLMVAVGTTMVDLYLTGLQRIASPDQECRLTPQYDLVYYCAFLGPIAFVILINTFIFVRIVVVLCQPRPKFAVTTKKSIKKIQIQGSLAVMVLLGVTWIFGVLAVSHARLAFQYIFCITNSLQGFFIFVFRCLKRPEVRNAWKSFLASGSRRRKRDSQSTSRSNVPDTTPFNSARRNTPQALANGTVHLSLAAKVMVEKSPAPSAFMEHDHNEDFEMMDSDEEVQ